MKLYLHIGTSKTGTTTLQDLLYENNSVLNKHGIHFLQTGGHANNRGLVAYCMNDDRSDAYIESRNINEIDKRLAFRNKIDKELETELQNLPENIKSIVVSSEHFHSQTSSEEEIKRTFNFFKKYFDDIEVLCYVREQSERCVSLYSTAIKSGKYRHPLSLMVGNCEPDNYYYNYFDQLSKWAEVYGKENLTVRLFQREALLGGDLIKDFFSIIFPQIDPTILKIAQSKNESFNAKGQLFGRLINIAVNEVDSDGSYNSLRFKTLKKIALEFKGKGEDIDEVLYKEIYSRFSESNIKLNEEFLGGQGNCFLDKTLKKENNKPPLHDLTNKEVFAIGRLVGGLIDDLIKLESKNAVENYKRSTKLSVKSDIKRVSKRTISAIKRKLFGK